MPVASNVVMRFGTRRKGGEKASIDERHRFAEQKGSEQNKNGIQSFIRAKRTSSTTTVKKKKK
jgi:hypothetical protein